MDSVRLWFFHALKPGFWFWDRFWLWNTQYWSAFYCSFQRKQKCLLHFTPHLSASCGVQNGSISLKKCALCFFSGNKRQTPFLFFKVKIAIFLCYMPCNKLLAAACFSRKRVVIWSSIELVWKQVVILPDLVRIWCPLLLCLYGLRISERVNNYEWSKWIRFLLPYLLLHPWYHRKVICLDK